MQCHIWRIVSACLFTSCCALLTFAQTSTHNLNGRIRDGRNAVIANATITLFARASGVRLTATSEATGTYNFEHLSTGDYLLSVEAAGFARSVRAVRVEQNQQLDVTLEVGGVNDEVIVTAAGVPQTADEIAKAVSRVSLMEIEQRDEFSIAEALRLTPGLRVQQLGGPGALVNIKTRGLRNEDTAVLIDGNRFRDAAAIGGDATAYITDLLVINQNCLEVLRGSGSSLYGTNAIGGVINLVSEEGGGSARGQLQIETGSLGLLRGRGTVAGGWRDDRLIYSAGLAHLNVTRGVDKDDTARNTSGQAFAKYRLTPASFLSGRIFVADTFAQLNDSPFNAPNANLPATGIIEAIPLALEQQRLREAGLPVTLGNATFIPNLNDPDSRRSSNLLAGVVTFDQRINDALNLRLNYHGLATSRVFRDGPAGVRFEPLFNNESVFDARIDTASARADLRLGRFNLLTAGYEFEREAFDNPTRDFNPDPARRTNARTQITQRSHAVFAQDQIRLLDERLQLSLAFRAQFFNLSRPEFSGGAPQYTGINFTAPPNAYTGDGALAYFFRATGTKLRAHVGNGYRAPSLYERFGTGFFGGSFSPYGDPRLRADRSIAADGGIDQSLAKGRARVSATYFYTRLQEVIAFDSSGFITPATDPFGRFGGYRNTGGGLARGVELSVNVAPTRTTELAASYTYTNADQRRPSSVAGFIPVFGISEKMFTLYANQRIGKRVDVTFDLFAAGDYFVPFGFPSRAFVFDGPVKADLGASYTLPVGDDRAIRFYGKVDNVLNRTYFENGFRTPRAAFTGGMSYRF